MTLSIYGNNKYVVLCVMVGHVKISEINIRIEMVIYYKMTITISLNTNIIKHNQMSLT